jgi:hypothetical protein
MLGQHGKSQSARAKVATFNQLQVPNQESNRERSLKGWKVATYSYGKVATKKYKTPSKPEKTRKTQKRQWIFTP